MSKILAVVFLSGASCVSHIDESHVLRVTLASKTPCAVIIREPVANPFKRAQLPNEVPAVAAAAPPPKKSPPKKKKKKKKKKAKR